MNKMQKKELLEDAESFEDAVKLGMHLARWKHSTGTSLAVLTASLAMITVEHMNKHFQAVMPLNRGSRIAQAVACHVLEKQIVAAIADDDDIDKFEKNIAEIADDVLKEIEQHTTVIKTKSDLFEKMKEEWS